MERFGRFRALQKHRYAARLIGGVNVSRIRRTASARAESPRSICKLRLPEHKGGSGAEKSCTRKRSCPRAHRRASCNCGTHYSKSSSAVYGSRLSLVLTDSTKLASAEGQRIDACIFIRPPESDICRFVDYPEIIRIGTCRVPHTPPLPACRRQACGGFEPSSGRGFQGKHHQRFDAVR